MCKTVHSASNYRMTCIIITGIMQTSRGDALWLWWPSLRTSSIVSNTMGKTLRNGRAGRLLLSFELWMTNDQHADQAERRKEEEEEEERHFSLIDKTNLVQILRLMTLRKWIRIQSSVNLMIIGRSSINISKINCVTSHTFIVIIYIIFN